MTEAILYTTPGQPESDSARKLLEAKGVRVRVVDVTKGKLEGFLKRDLGTDRTPVLITEEGVAAGLSDIQARLAK